jgi:hypothetical protein
MKNAESFLNESTLDKIMESEAHLFLKLQIVPPVNFACQHLNYWQSNTSHHNLSETRS